MKHQTVFVCQECGHQEPRWLGRCPGCGAWNSLVEERRTNRRSTSMAVGGEAPARPQRLVDVAPARTRRMLTGIGELDRVMGGGLVPGSILLIGGEPGIGKSTLMLQVCSRLARDGMPVLYITGEESAEQVRLRAERLGVDLEQMFILCTVEMGEIAAAIEELSPGLVVVDSIQTVYSAALASAPGSVGQVRECTAELLRQAKGRRLAVFIVGHVTKYGAIAGPKTLEHMVDTVMYFEGEGFQQYRIVRAAKNRYGSTNEIGVFEMTETGLAEVANPSVFFLSDRRSESSGSAVVATVEGTRPLLVEVQALAARTPFAVPQRVATGFDARRLNMLLCVIERRAGIVTAGKDVFINVAGGLRLTEPAADLATVVAIASSVRDVPLPPDMVFIGEVGLAGEVRGVARIESRLAETGRLGFSRALVPRAASRTRVPAGLEAIPVGTVSEAFSQAGLG